VPELGDGQRLDAALATREIARSRTHAAELISSGRVRVNGNPVIKASHRVVDTDDIAVERLDHYVSRAAHKLIAALDEFPVDVTGRRALDVGASTGGFTQVLLERNVAHVIALDVGHNQISPSIRSDARVTVIEGVNARYLNRDNLAGLLKVDAVDEADAPNLVVGDLSFISLTHVIPALKATATADADFVLLIKPQFEVGRQGVKEGIVTNAGKREDAINGVLWNAFDAGLGTAGILSSPILGGAGNREYIAWFNASVGTNPTQWREHVHKLAGGAA
jgi:23S rRNA (cytidine1920-2'-O)/16S rRNA (cytidine1409-2'-O)-methyltransferase